MGETKSHHVLILSPFSDCKLRDLETAIDVTYESWAETRILWDPNKLSERLVQESINILVIESDFVFQEVFEGTPNLQFLGVCRGSTDHIDIDSATKNGVIVVNTPGRNDQAVAEHAIGLMLSLARKIPYLHQYIIKKKWENPVEPYITMQGIELANRTVGIIGFGAIGTRLSSIAKGLGMKCLVYDPYTSEIPKDIKSKSLECLLQISDFVTITAPLTSETRGMFNSHRLRIMKDSSYLINISNSEIVSENALITALKRGALAGAALDVFETHPVEPTSPLLSLDNVILTPHVGGATQETIERHSNMMTNDIFRFIRGHKPKNLVNQEIWASNV